MASSLPSPPPHHTLPYTSLPMDHLDALRSSCGQLIVALEETQGLVSWGGEAGITSWPSLLSAYQRVMSLLSLLNHHMVATSAPAQANAYGSSTKPSLTLSQHVVHPHIPSDPAAEAWIQALLSTHSAVAHEPPPEPAVGDPAAHEVRRQRALRVCAALSDMHDWKGRVGLVGDAETDAGGEAAGGGDSGTAPAADAMDEDKDDDDDDDMFGSGDEEDKKPAAAPVPEAQKVPAVPALGKAETELELRRLLGLMARGQPPS